jgi:hypothetical protein
MIPHAAPAHQPGGLVPPLPHAGEGAERSEAGEGAPAIARQAAT